MSKIITSDEPPKIPANPKIWKLRHLLDYGIFRFFADLFQKNSGRIDTSGSMIALLVQLQQLRSSWVPFDSSSLKSVTDFKSVIRTDGLTCVGARDACASKKDTLSHPRIV